MQEKNMVADGATAARKRWEKPVVITPADVGSDTLDLKGIFATPDHYSPGLLTPVS